MNLPAPLPRGKGVSGMSTYLRLHLPKLLNRNKRKFRPFTVRSNHDEIGADQEVVGWFRFAICPIENLWNQVPLSTSIMPENLHIRNLHGALRT
jgi:hypothetical protein